MSHFIRALLAGLVAMLVMSAGVLAAEGEAKELPPIRVGVVVSHFTATGPSWGAPYGYEDQVTRIAEIRSKDIDLTPIIEPGTEKEGELPAVLEKHFPGRQPVNGFDPAALRRFDVILAYHQSNMKAEMSAALVAAVKEGVGIVSQGCGSVTPGYTADNNLLAGMSDAEYGWNGNPVDCEIIGTHPLLGDLSGATGTLIRAMPNGCFGQLAGVPLMRVKNRLEVHVPRGKPVLYDFYPLYISQLGKGRIVGVAFAHYQPLPQELQKATGNKFLLRCVRWAAGRAVE